jgi:hypothetical protein
MLRRQRGTPSAGASAPLVGTGGDTRSPMGVRSAGAAAASAAAKDRISSYASSISEISSTRAVTLLAAAPPAVPPAAPPVASPAAPPVASPVEPPTASPAAASTWSATPPPDAQ